MLKASRPSQRSDDTVLVLEQVFVYTVTRSRLTEFSRTYTISWLYTASLQAGRHVGCTDAHFPSRESYLPLSALSPIARTSIHLMFDTRNPFASQGFQSPQVSLAFHLLLLGEHCRFVSLHAVCILRGSRAEADAVMQLPARAAPSRCISMIEACTGASLWAA